MTSENAICTEGLTVCPIGPHSQGYECLDVASDKESCGGCSSSNTGVDCTLIDGAQDVTCMAGTCQVETCEVGFAVNVNGTGCDIVSGRKNREKLVFGSLKGVEKFWGY
jgi:hypothetical protein